MQDIELDIGGTKFKGVWIAILVSFGSTIGGGIWAASEFFSRLEAQEAAVQAVVAHTAVIEERFANLKDNTTTDVSEIDAKLATVQQQLQDNDVSGLQGKLAELGANLATIMERQKELLSLQERVIEAEKTVKGMEVTVQKAENATANVNDMKQKADRIQKEIDDLWEALDYLANPLGN